MVVLASPRRPRATYPPLTAEELYDAVAPAVARLADWLAKKHPRIATHRDDLEQVGLVALWEMAGGYDPGFGSPKTYAMTRVKGAMVDYLRGLKSMDGRNTRSAARHVAAGNRLPAVLSLSDRAYRTDEGDARGSDGFDWPAVTDPEPADEPAKEVLALIHSTGAMLDTRRRVVLVEYLTTDRTQKQIGEAHGLSESRVSQVIASAVDAVRKAMQARGMTSFN